MTARSNVSALANPFAAPPAAPVGFAPLASSNPFAAARDGARDSGSDLDAAALGPHTYALVKNGPEVSPEEVEVAGTTSIEVMVLWGTNVLHVDHLTPPRSYYVGEGEGAADKVACDYLLPGEALGATRAPIVLAREGSAWLVLLPRTTGNVEIPGTGCVAFEDLVSSGRARASREVPGAHEVELPAGSRARMQLAGSELGLRINTVKAGKPVPAGLLRRLDPAANGFFGVSFLLHAAIAASVAMFMPSLGADDADALSRDQILMMQHMLTASASHEQDARELEQSADDSPSESAGGTGTRAKDAEGTMGNVLSHETGHKYGVEGPHDNPDPHIARLKAVAEAREFGLVGIINAGGGDANAPTAAWGREDSSGSDARSALGNMWGDSLGDAFGQGGLGLSGNEEGGGGIGEGIGLGDIGTIGHGRDVGEGDDFGRGHGLSRRPHEPKGPRVTQMETQVNGRLPSEVIQRIVRQNFGRFRMCYEDGLRGNPSLQGRVGVKFAIDRSGAVSMASDGGSDLPDQGVVKCVVRGFQNLSFPAPEGGIVTVVYPIVFSPGT